MKRTPIKRRKPLRSKRWPPESPRKPFAASTPAALEPQDNRRVAGHTALISRGHNPQRKSFGRLALKAPTVAERIRWRRIREEVGCMACRREGLDPFGAVDIHHVLDGNRRISHGHSFGLHAVGCHKEGTAERPARHPMQGGRVMFERRVGATDFELMAECNALLEKANV